MPLAVWWRPSPPARAQSRPLVTEDPETVPAGFILIEAGLDFFNGVITRHRV
jgi:hypothetical protein